MQRNVTEYLLNNQKLLNHFFDHSYWIKELNRNPKALKDFQKQMKVIYKERTTDKINNVIDSVDMISSVIETTL